MRCITHPSPKFNDDLTKLLLTHWGRATHICVGNLTTIGSDNGLSPGRRQAIIWTNAGILLIGPLGTNFNEILIEIRAFSFTKIHSKMSSGKWRPFCLGLNVVKLELAWIIISHWSTSMWVFVRAIILRLVDLSLLVKEDPGPILLRNLNTV